MTNEFEYRITPFAREAAKILEAEIKRQLSLQGHKLTGALEASIETKVMIKDYTTARIAVLANDYALPLNDGVPATRIPFSPGSGKKTSKYIQGLMNFARLRFNLSDPSEIKGAAFAIAYKHKQQGMPTRASLQFSKTGQRKFALDEAIRDAQPKIQALAPDFFTLKKIKI